MRAAEKSVTPRLRVPIIDLPDAGATERDGMDRCLPEMLDGNDRYQ